jgi:cytochrome c
MSTLDRVAAWALGLALAGCALPVRETPSSSRSPDLGRIASSEEVTAWDISIAPSGEGLPPGSGTARQGGAVYEAKCAACHGERGQGKPADALAGGIGSLATPHPVRTVGSYWPYATTLFDYVRRAMPLGHPLSLNNDEVYAVSAYVLYLNGIVGEETAMNAATLPLVKMPNRDGFINAWEGAR